MEVSKAEKLRDRIYERLAARRPQIEKDEKYYRGDQPLAFATAEWRKANAARYAGFSDNWCGTVVDAEKERIQPIGVTGLEDKTAAGALWDELRRNEFDALFSQAAVTTLTTSRAFMSVWADQDGKPLVSAEHPSHVEIEYDWENPRIRVAALKTWVDDTHEFATLYTRAEVFKWQRKRSEIKDERAAQSAQGRSSTLSGGGWSPRTGDRDDTWPIRNPLDAVPIVELPNRPTLLGEPVSEIRGVQPMQDAINLLWAYLFLAADYASMPARVALGAEPPVIPIIDKDTGEVVGTRPVDMKDFAEKRIVFLSGENAKIDQWEAARLDVFTSTIEIGVGHIAAQTRTPPHYLVANKGISNLSGDALTAAEIGLVQKANEFITFTNPGMREILRLVALVLNNQAWAGQAQLATIVWKNREIRSEAQMSDALLKKRQMGYPLEYLLELEGNDPKTIERIISMVEQEQADVQLNQAARELSAYAAGSPVGASIPEGAAADR